MGQHTHKCVKTGEMLYYRDPLDLRLYHQRLCRPPRRRLHHLVYVQEQERECLHIRTARFLRVYSRGRYVELPSTVYYLSNSLWDAPTFKKAFIRFERI